MANPLVNEPEFIGPLPSAFIPFMPNMKYVRNNLAPEQFPREALRALAQAQVLGEENGAFSRAHGEYFLPNQLIENRPDDFAVNRIDRFSRGERNPFESLGLRFGLRPTANNRWGEKIYPEQLGYDMQPMLEGAANFAQNSLIRDENAKKAALMYAIKSQKHTPKETVERWNGKGQVRVGNRVVADSKNHLAKVVDMREMMKRPENAEMRDVWQHLYNQARIQHGPREESSSLSIAR